jgi:YfiR/HmsC-like
LHDHAGVPGGSAPYIRDPEINPKPAMAFTARSSITAKWLALLLIFVVAFRTRAQAPATEYEVKAAYLLNFGKFIKWPESAIPSGTDKFSICVLGDDPFGNVLNTTVRDEKIDGKPVIARRIGRSQDITGCQVLFISRSEEKQFRKLLQSFSKSAILTVSDMPGFMDHDGMIQFTLVNNRVRFEVNLDSVQEAGLTLSSELLKVASFVKGKSRTGVL